MTQTPSFDITTDEWNNDPRMKLLWQFMTCAADNAPMFSRRVDRPCPVCKQSSLMAYWKDAGDHYQLWVRCDHMANTPCGYTALLGNRPFPKKANWPAKLGISQADEIQFTKGSASSIHIMDCRCPACEAMGLTIIRYIYLQTWGKPNNIQLTSKEAKGVMLTLCGRCHGLFHTAKDPFLPHEAITEPVLE